VLRGRDVDAFLIAAIVVCSFSLIYSLVLLYLNTKIGKLIAKHAQPIPKIMIQNAVKRNKELKNVRIILIFIGILILLLIAFSSFVKYNGSDIIIRYAIYTIAVVVSTLIGTQAYYTFNL
jgi:hypothetical protein